MTSLRSIEQCVKTSSFLDFGMEKHAEEVNGLSPFLSDGQLKNMLIMFYVPNILHKHCKIKQFTMAIAEDFFNL